MDLFSKCKELYEKIRYFEYGIPVDGVIKNVPSAEYYVKNYHFLKPEEFEKYKGGICWDYVEYERKFLEVNDIDFNQYYLITNTPPNYDTHTFITVKDGDELIYIESSFKRVEHIIDGVQKFKSLEDIVKLITTNMWYCNDNDKHFDEFKYDVCKFKGHPQYGCTCEEYMKWMDNNSDIVIQDVSINPKKVNNDELAVEEFAVNKVDTKFTQFVCESANDPEEYDETLHDHIADEDDVYNEASVLKFPKKVNNVPFDIMYFGSNIDFGNESIKLDHNELFLTPYIGLASIFITDRKEYFKPLPKDRPHNTNIGYDEWGLSPSELQKPLKEVHVSLDDIPNVTPFEFDYTGYIYAIDVSQYKNNLYQKDWMTSDREFILKDINPVPIKEKIKWTHHVYVRGKKNTDDVYNESWTDFKNGVHPSSGLMFHVSLKNDMDGKIISPQLPSYITDGGKLDDNYQEDTKTKRLCVSPSIEGCLIAILNYNKIREHVGDKFYVYTPEKPFSQYKHKTNKEIVKDKLVFDANITKEAWILEPCKLKLYGIIKLKKVKDLKKKPTVEKNIKMNTIKLDYEWIMTPKASGKFNKVIGDSPDKEDTKEKPIKEYDNILVSNEEFFMEVSKYERRLERQFQRDYERRPKSAIKDYTDKEDKNDRYKRESVNNRVRTLKDINEKQHRRNAPIKTRESKNKNKIKALKLLDYDPKTNTIKGNITLPDGSKKERVPYIIENNLARQTGPFVTEIDGFRDMVTYGVDEDELSKTEKARIQKVNEALDKFEANGERFIIVIPRRFLNQKQLSGLGASLHELGHFTYIHQPDDAEAERARAQSGSVKDKLTEGSPAYSHIIKNPLMDMQKYGIDESNEFSADKYAADRIGLRNYEKMLKKLFQFGKKSIKKQVAEQVDAINNQIKDLLNAESRKTSIEFSKEVKQIAKESADMFANWANNAQVCIINEKSTIKDLDEKIADVNKKLKEFSKRSNDISKEFKDLSKELEKYNSERDMHVSNLKAQRNSAKMNSEAAQRYVDAFPLLNRFKNLQSQLEGFKKWTKDYDVEMDARINYIRKYYEKKNIGESCLIMDNEEFFALTE